MMIFNSVQIDDRAPIVDIHFLKKISWKRLDNKYFFFILGNYYNIYWQIKLSADPRTRYYFTDKYLISLMNVQTKERVTQSKPSYYGPDDVFCTVPNTNGFDGFWGEIT